MASPIKIKILVIVGPTAAGKSRVAVEVAKQIQGEIITCDSMQVYRGLDICTDKPRFQELQQIPHHLIDIVEVYEEFSVSEWRKKVLEIISQIASRGRVPMVVGGSGLYYRSLIKGLFPGPGADWNLRQQLMDNARGQGSGYLYQELKEADPDSAKSINPKDTRRIIRALEIYYLSGQPKSKLISKTRGLSPEYFPVVVGLELPRQFLYQQINRRVEEMWQAGLVDEIKNLVKYHLSRSVRQIIGYKEVKSYLDGLYSEQEARRLMARNTRRLAKRQLSLFRQDEKINWVQVSPQAPLDEVAGEIVEIYKKTQEEV